MSIFRKRREEKKSLDFMEYQRFCGHGDCAVCEVECKPFFEIIDF